jgi:hypothetical protein
MSNLDKNIIITPNVGASDDPKIVFSAANTTSSSANITIRAYPTSNGTLSFEGSAGQLFSITNNLTGSLFSVNDISGIPSIEVLDTGRVNLAQYNGSVVIGANTSATTSNSNTTGELVVFGGVGVTGNIYVGGTSAGSNGIYTDILRYAANGLPWVMGSGGGGGGTSIDQAARDTANSASANTFIIQGVDASQNVRLDFSNAAITIIQGVDTSQNARMTIADGVDASQNVRLDYSNTAITIVQGVDVGQNTRLTVIEGTDASQNVRIDYSNTALTIAQGVDNSQNVRLDFSNTRMTIIEGTDASQNVRIDYSNTAITIIQGTDTSQNARMVIIEGTDVSQNARMTIADGVDASQNVRLDYSNTALTIVQGVDNSQNVRIDFSNTAIIIIQGVDTTQNTRLTVIEGTDASQNVRLDYSNAAITIIQGVDSGQNSRMTIIEGTDTSQNARMVIIEGTDVSQNARMTIADGVDASQNSRLDYSNTAITIIQGTDVTQNTRLTVIEGTDASQNVRIDYSNTALTIAQGVDNSQNVRLDYSNTAINQTLSSWTANTVIVANSTGYLSNTSNLQFFQSNNNLQLANTFTAANLVLTGTNAGSSFPVAGSLQMAGGAYIAGASYIQQLQSFSFTSTGGTVLQNGLTTTGSTNYSFSLRNLSGPFGSAQGGNLFVKGSTYVDISDTGTIAEPIYYNYFIGPILRNAPAPVTYKDLSTVHINAPSINVANTNLTVTNSWALYANGAIYSNTNISAANTFFAGSNGITFADGTKQTTAATGNANTFGWLANTIIVANSTGYLSNSNSFFVASNNAIVVPNVVITQAATASFPLNFGQGLGNKIGLYDFGSGTGYGFGVQSQKLQIFHGNSTDHTSFGHGSSSSFTEQFRVAGVASSVNYLQVTGSIANSSPILSAQGSSANVAINLVPKGNGSVMITGNTTSTINVANSLYVGGVVGFANANNISVVYQSYNSSTNSLDVVFG